MWKLSFPMVAQTTAPMFVFTCLGDTSKIQALLGSNEGFLNAIDAVANKSALHVSTLEEIEMNRLICMHIRLHFNITSLM